MEQRHIIKRQIIELTVQDPAVAPTLQDQASRVYRQRIVPLIERYCTELGQPDRLYRIDSLELDLGVLDADDFEEQFVAKTNTALRQALAAQISSQEQSAVKMQRSPKMQSALELFAFFMRTGSLPWWADDSQPRLLDENLQQLLAETPRELRSLLQELARDESLRGRMVSQYGDKQLEQLAGLLVPAYERSFRQDIKVLRNLLQKTKTGADWSPSRLRHGLWDIFLEMAAFGGQQHASLEAFYRAALERVAAKFGKTSGALMVEIGQVLQDERVGGSRPFRELLKTLTAAPSGELAQRLAQLQAESDEPLVQVWAGLRMLAPRLSRPQQAQWLSALNRLGSSPTPQRILQLLQSELVAEHELRPEELFGLAQLLQSAPGSGKGQPQAATGVADQTQETGKEIAIRLQRYQSDGGPLAEVWAALRVICLRLSPQARTAWLNALEAAGSETAAEGIVRLLNADPVQHGLRPDQRARLLKMIHTPLVPPIFGVQNGGTQGGHFSAADELSVANAGLVLLWPFLASFFTHLGLVEEKEFKDLAARQRGVGLLQVLATKDAAPPEYLLPLNKLLCGMDLKQVFDFGPPLLKSEAKECSNLLKAVIAQASILRNMSVTGFRGSFLLRPGLLSVRDGLWLLRVERQTYDIVLDRFPWSWQWVKLPWMEAPLRVEW